MPRADFITSIVLISLGVGAAVESWRMPRLEHLGVSAYSAPGLVPFLLGAVIAGLGLILFLRSVRAGGYRLRAGGAVRDEEGGPVARLRLPLTLLLTFGYALGLVGRLPFWAATAIFVAAFLFLFDWRTGDRAAKLARRGALAAAFGLVVGVAVSALFQDVFLLRLP